MSSISIFANWARRWTYSVESPGAGRLLYREGNREYTFPVYQEDGELIVVGVPSSQRIHYFFNWYRHPQDFSRAARERILPRIIEHLRYAGGKVKVFDQFDAGGETFAFHPELFAARSLASELLTEAGFNLLADYTTLDISHEDYGLEVCGIRDEPELRRMAEVLQQAFPHWHHQNVCREDDGRDPGWALALSMFPSRSFGPGRHDEIEEE